MQVSVIRKPVGMDCSSASSQSSQPLYTLTQGSLDPGPLIHDSPMGSAGFADSLGPTGSESSAFGFGSLTDVLARFRRAAHALTEADCVRVCANLEAYMGPLLVSQLRELKQCDECGRLVQSNQFNLDVESRGDTTVRICDSCLLYCKPCGVEYAPGASDKHETCLQQAAAMCRGHEWSENIDECDNCFMSKAHCTHTFDIADYTSARIEAPNNTHAQANTQVHNHCAADILTDASKVCIAEIEPALALASCVCITCSTQATCESCDLSDAVLRCAHCVSACCAECVRICERCANPSCCRH